MPFVRPIAMLVIAAATIIPLIGGSSAQPKRGTVAAGQRLAEQFCSRCHVIAPSGHGSWTDAPAFDVIANREGVTAGQLSAFIQKPHMHMLNTERPPGEANALAAYIMSLRHHG
jgi:cytochrome c